MLWMFWPFKKRVKSQRNPIRQRDRVLIGKDGWLFMRNDTNHLQEQLSGTYPYPADFAAQWQKLFAYRAQRLAELGCRYAYSFVPHKEKIYQHYLPDNVKIEGMQADDVVVKAANGQVDMIDLRPAFYEAKEPEHIYEKTDTHWNGRGALMFYRKLMQHWNLPAPDESNIEFYPLLMNDLSRRLRKDDPAYGAGIQLRVRKYKTIYDNRLNNRGRMVITAHEDKSLPTIVVFRDSNFNLLTNVIANSFSRMVVCWQPNIDYGLVEKEKPDFVLNLQAERYLAICPDDINGPTAAELERLKREATASDA